MAVAAPAMGRHHVDGLDLGGVGIGATDAAAGDVVGADAEHEKGPIRRRESRRLTDRRRRGLGFAVARAELCPLRAHEQRGGRIVRRALAQFDGDGIGLDGFGCGLVARAVGGAEVRRDEDRARVAVGIGRVLRVLLEDARDALLELDPVRGSERHREPARVQVGVRPRLAQLREERLERGLRDVDACGLVVDGDRPRAAGRAIRLLGRAPRPRTLRHGLDEAGAQERADVVEHGCRVFAEGPGQLAVREAAVEEQADDPQAQRVGERPRLGHRGLRPILQRVRSGRHRSRVANQLTTLNRFGTLNRWPCHR